MVKIIVDSTFDFPEKIREKLDIKVVPLQVVLDREHIYADKLEINVETVYDRIKNDQIVQTSLPLRSSFLDIFTSYAQQGIDFIYLAFSSELSGTYNSAVEILKEVQEQYPDVKMSVIDSKQGAISAGLVAIRAGEKALETDNFNEVETYIYELLEDIRFYFVLNDLTQLSKQGRIDSKVAVIGNKLKLKPVIHLQEGHNKIHSTTRGIRSAIKKLTKIVQHEISDTDQLVGITYSSNIDLGYELKERIETEVGLTDFIMEPIGSVVSNSIGLEAVGVAFFAKK